MTPREVFILVLMAFVVALALTESNWVAAAGWVFAIFFQLYAAVKDSQHESFLRTLYRRMNVLESR